ncbi:MAG: TerC family protein [Pseudomonadales bacterium]
MELLFQPQAWAALFALVMMEVVLGIDNLLFISIVTDKLPEAQRQFARRLGIGLALIFRLLLLTTLVWLSGLTSTVFDLGISGEPGLDGVPSFDTAFSWRDLILLAGGAFLVWKATTEIHNIVDPEPVASVFKPRDAARHFAMIIVQIILLDIVFSVDSILTAIGMTEHLPIMITAVIIAVAAMFLAADPLARFVHHNPTIIMLALAFLLSIGLILIAEGFGRHIPKGYIYAAIGFAAFVETLNMVVRKRSVFPPKQVG